MTKIVVQLTGINQNIDQSNISAENNNNGIIRSSILTKSMILLQEGVITVTDSSGP